MSQSNTAKEKVFTTKEMRTALTSWFGLLQERNVNSDGQKIKGRAWRAELRRMEPPYEVLISEAYAELYRRLAPLMATGEMTATDKLALALFICVAAQAKSHNPLAYQQDKDSKGKAKKDQDEKGRWLSFAAQLGEKLKGTPCLSRLRFNRLQEARDPQTFCLQLIRAVRLRGEKGVNIISLADGIFLWMREWQAQETHQPQDINPFNRNRIRWASEYLSTAGEK